MRTCSVTGCDRRHVARTLCQKHYEEARRYGMRDKYPLNTPIFRPCTIDNCDRPRKARGLCGAHYQRWRIHGDPITTRLIGAPYHRPTQDHPTPVTWPDTVQDSCLPIHCGPPRERSARYDEKWYARVAAGRVLCDGRAR